MRPIAIPDFIKKKFYLQDSNASICQDIRKHYPLINIGEPEVSVVIPAYNEEENILKTLSALTHNQCKYSVEILVVNNNSKDRTEFLVKDAGIPCILETTQGITAARNAGLFAAKGRYILNADADTIYPINWIEDMVKPLAENDNIATVYGNFSFIPTAGTPRWVYFIYEYLADFMRWLNGIFKDEAVNVYGFNSGFKKEEAIAVDGFNHPPGTNEDGWLALKLRTHNFGKLHQVKNSKALVWTADRRIQLDGGLFMGTIKRIKRMLGMHIGERNDL